MKNKRTKDNDIYLFQMVVLIDKMTITDLCKSYIIERQLLVELLLWGSSKNNSLAFRHN